MRVILLLKATTRDTRVRADAMLLVDSFDAAFIPADVLGREVLVGANLDWLAISICDKGILAEHGM
jgi:hypothetical protein